MNTLTNNQITGAILWTTVGFWPGILSFAVPKITVVALLIRILSPGAAHRTFLWTSTLLCVASLNVCIPLQLTSCKPTRSMWDMSVAKKECRDEWILVYYSVYAGCELLLLQSVIKSDINNSESLLCRCRLISSDLPCNGTFYIADEVEEEDCLECCSWYRLHVSPS
jgi:hypothetical protein